MVQVLVSLLPYQGNAQALALACLLSLLHHKYPQVRKATAEQLYMALVTHDRIWLERISEDDVSRRENALALLTQTAWELEDLHVVRPLVLTLSQLLQVPRRP
jgi:hypothetical protein